MKDQTDRLEAPSQPRRKARATISVGDKDRRAFLRRAMAQGLAAPAAFARTIEHRLPAAELQATEDLARCMES